MSAAEKSPLTKIETYTYSWNQKKNRFSSPNPHIPLNDPAKRLIEDHMNIIQNKSGIKSYSVLTLYLIFFIFVFLGYTVAYFLIASKNIVLGGVFLIVTPILSYFVFIGYTFVTGSQSERANAFLIKRFNDMNESLRPYKFKFFYSFTERNLQFLSIRRKILFGRRSS